MSQPGTTALTVEHDGAARAIAFSSDGSRFASGGDGSQVKIRAVATGAPLDLPCMGFVADLAFAPDGATIAVADFEQVLLHDSGTGVVRWQGKIQPDNSVNTVRFVPGGSAIAAATDLVVVLLDAATGAPGRRVDVDKQISGLDLSADGGRFALAIDERHGGNHHNAGSARVIDLTTGAEITRFTPDNAVFDVAFSPDGSLVLFGSADGTARVFDAADGTELWQVDTESDHIAFDPKGRWTVIGGSNGTARIVEADSGVEKSRVSHDGAVTHVAFAPNGKWAASAGIDGVVHVFDVLTGRDRYDLQPPSEVLAMRFSPDSRGLGLGLFGSAIVVANGEP